MGATPKYKVYSAEGEYVASCVYLEDAAALVALYGDGARIRAGHRRTLWLEGAEPQPASESYDYVASRARMRELRMAVPA